MSDTENVYQTETQGKVLVVIPVSEQIGMRIGPLQDQTDAITDSIEQGSVRNVVVDAGNMAYLPSRVISAFIQIWEAAVEHGGSFGICNLSDESLQSLIVTRLDTRWTILDSREAAIDAVGN